MVRLVDPQAGMSIYDPCSGSGGMLIYARNHVADNGGNPADLFLAGQEANGTTWSISKMNMLLHGIRDADLRNDDTLADPEHVRDGELMRFDRVITNPPFSQNYDKSQLEHTERFRYGYTPEGGKKADLMFLQHMLAVLKSDGIVATVMPHGVLFRGGEEGKIRQRIIEDDLLDTVIGLGPNLFYGTGIPAAILILRAKGSKPPERRGKVLFINADREYTEGRAQNTCAPKHEQKIVATYRDFADVDGFARSSPLDELAENDFNCNIRRYADNAAPPNPTTSEPTSTAASRWPNSTTPPRCSPRAVSTSTRSSPTEAMGTPTGTTTSHIRGPRSSPRRDPLPSSGSHRSRPRQVVARDRRTQRCLASPRLGTLVGLRTDLVDAFIAHLRPEGVDAFAAAGMAATWWEDSVFDLKPPPAEDGGRPRRLAHHRRSHPGRQERPRPRRPDRHPTPRRNRPRPTRDLAAEAARLDAEIQANGTSDDEDAEPGEDGLSPEELKKLKAARIRVKKDLKTIDARLLQTARDVLDGMTDRDATGCIIGELKSRIQHLVNDHYANLERRINAWYDNLAGKYGTTLRQLEAERDEAAGRLNKHLLELGYE
jgi:type I restriction enzyme M protein